MAFFPCDLCKARFRGPAQHLYPARLSRGTALRSHKRLCPTDMQLVLDALEHYLVADGDVQIEHAAYEGICQGCHRLMDDFSDQVFVTAYPKSRERLDFWFPLHPSCKPTAPIDTLIS